ncbi:hypothetical protein JOD25_001715 [Kurthia huakuii]|nr:hypothetical protein [Kurthia huakuii]
MRAFVNRFVVANDASSPLTDAEQSDKVEAYVLQLEVATR